MTVATRLLIVSLSPYRYLSGYVATLVFSFLLIIMIMHFTTFTHHLHPSCTPYTTDTTDVHVPCILMLCIFEYLNDFNLIIGTVFLSLCQVYKVCDSRQ